MRLPSIARLIHAARIVALCLIGLMVLSVIPVALLRWINPPTTSFMMARRAEGIFNPARRVPIQYEWTDMDNISRNAQLAMIAAEDQKFLEHEGFDFESIEKAIDDRDGGRMRGASTISQQVAKNLFLWSGRSWIRKGMEAGFTVLIETFWPKRRILEIYLNVAEFGDGIYGVGAAAPKYFGKPAAKLSRHESALLASVLPSPKRMHADRPSKYVQRRAWWIERQMMRLGSNFLDPVEAMP